MQAPGSNPDIPVEAEVTFREQWDRAQPGTKRIFAYLEVAQGRKLVVFPHREWKPTLGQPMLCVLYPVRNAAIAAPVGGIPDEEKLPVPSSQVAQTSPFGHTVYAQPGTNGSRGHVASPRGVEESIEAVNQAYSQIADGLERLDEALNRLEESLRRKVES